jgi:phage-related minor tail protein
LLNDTSRSLFNTAIGDPIDRYVSGGLSSAVNNLLGNNAPSDNSNSSDGSNGQTGGGQGQGLVGGLLGSVGGSLLSGIGNLFGSNSPSVFSTSSLIAHQGGQVASAVAAPAVSAASSALSSIGSAIMSFFATGGMFEGGTRVPFATGGVFGSGTRHAYASGDVFTDPTTMPMAILGEAGPEAVMPLRRGADGKLGIATGGGGGGGGPSVVVNAPISVGANALGNNGKMSSQQARDLQNQLHRTIKAAVFGVMADQSRPGGMITPPAG